MWGFQARYTTHSDEIITFVMCIIFYFVSIEDPRYNTTLLCVIYIRQMGGVLVKNIHKKKNLKKSKTLKKIFNEKNPEKNNVRKKCFFVFQIPLFILLYGIIGHSAQILFSGIYTLLRGINYE